MRTRHETAVEQLLMEAAAAHHEAFEDTGGDDPEWPLWYANFLIERLPGISGFAGTRSELVFWLVRLADEYREANTAIPWARFYAERLAAL